MQWLWSLGFLFDGLGFKALVWGNVVALLAINIAGTGKGWYYRTVQTSTCPYSCFGSLRGLSCQGPDSPSAQVEDTVAPKYPCRDCFEAKVG